MKRYLCTLLAWLVCFVETVACSHWGNIDPEWFTMGMLLWIFIEIDAGKHIKD